LDEKLGFTAENVYNQVKSMLWLEFVQITQVIC
jgi:hypothetical protein